MYIPKEYGVGQAAGRGGERWPTRTASTGNCDWASLIHDVSRLRRSAFDRVLKPAQRDALAVVGARLPLARGDGMTQSQLAEELDLGKVAVGGLIDRLESPRSLRRRPTPPTGA